MPLITGYASLIVRRVAMPECRQSHPDLIHYRSSKDRYVSIRNTVMRRNIPGCVLHSSHTDDGIRNMRVRTRKIK